MFCTDDERKNCQVEKMGCKGCYYSDDSNLLEQLEQLKKEKRMLIKQRDYFKKLYLESNNFFFKRQEDYE